MERDYHGTSIAPAHANGMERDYHGTSIAPAEEMDEDQKWRTETPAPTHRYVSYSEQRHAELHKRPEKHVTWEEIRQRSWRVCCNKAK